MMDLFIASGAPRGKIEKFLAADLEGAGAVRDQIAANMTNELLQALGQSGRQTPRDVERIRQRGGWTALGRRPRE